jgi:tRNA pseudouridine32 synthase/23S rRNA pseudouridine746 synthase
MTAEEIQARILYRDGLVLVIDKPAGLPVHAGPGGGDNLERHFEHLRFGLPRPPALAHRLDRDTSGCLALGRHPKALRRLGRLFSLGLVEKTYWAVVAGSPTEDAGLIDKPLKKVSTKQGGFRMVVADDGQAAQTGWRVMGRGDGVTWLELKPKTGRTHQIRVHCAAMGWPLLGDPQYGGPAGMPMQLHARSLVLPLYPAKPPVAVTAPVPSHMLERLRACGFAGD